MLAEKPRCPAYRVREKVAFSCILVLREYLPRQQIQGQYRFQNAFSGARPWRTRSRISVWKASHPPMMLGSSLSTLSRVI